MPTSPLVSVLMPVFDAERYVASAVDSILGQTFKDFEFLIVDDGSTDRSLELLRRYAGRDRRIRLTTRANRGVSVTRNELLRAAVGEFIAPMDADDIALPHRLERELEFLAGHPDVVCVGASYRIIDQAGRLIHRGFPVTEDDEQIQRLLLRGHCSLHQPTVMYRRDAALRVGGYDERYRASEDMDLWLRMGEIGKLANMTDQVLEYRVYGKSISDRLQETALAEMRRASEDACGRRGLAAEVEVNRWRPSKTAASRQEFLVRFGWWAFNSGERETAIVYALRAIATLPSNVEGWRLLACAALKRLPATSGAAGPERA